MSIDDETKKQERVAVYALIKNDKNEYLFTKTTSGSRTVWNFPGGGVETSEGLKEALQRECREEIGLSSLVIKKLLYRNKKQWINPDFPQSIPCHFYFEVEDIKNLTSSHVNNSELETRWFRLEEVPQDMLLDVDRECIEYFKTLINA